MYTLEALLSKSEILEPALQMFPSAILVQFPQNIGMIPADGYLLRDLEIYYQGGTEVTRTETQQFSASVHPDFERLIIGVDRLAQHLSLKGLVAYIEATFIGGYGGHRIMLWENGKRAGDPRNSINEVLHLFNVVPNRNLDEFDTLGLGRYRSTRQWARRYHPDNSG